MVTTTMPIATLSWRVSKQQHPQSTSLRHRSPPHLTRGGSCAVGKRLRQNQASSCGVTSSSPKQYTAALPEGSMIRSFLAPWRVRLLACQQNHTNTLVWSPSWIRKPIYQSITNLIWRPRCCCRVTCLDNGNAFKCHHLPSTDALSSY